ncbi:hypothetical protein KSP9073_03480 [Kushneria phyllosphaerae]|uniref:Uncharacterized protein n=1 Tax=Kushneria phyllosphaerae TaxID=2100822 RepID=A0A2R8CRJ0_9GAMM|nr:hypothetical protein KSP9073_03480 [Kushneria phyllosphaerae]
MDMRSCFYMNSNDICSSFRKCWNVIFRINDHQMDV